MLGSCDSWKNDLRMRKLTPVKHRVHSAASGKHLFLPTVTEEGGGGGVGGVGRGVDSLISNKMEPRQQR